MKRLISILFSIFLISYCAVSAADQDFRNGDLQYKLSGTWHSWMSKDEDSVLYFHTPLDMDNPVALIVTCDMEGDLESVNRDQFYLDSIVELNGTEFDLDQYYIGDIPCATFRTNDIFEVGAVSTMVFLMLTENHYYIVACSTNSGDSQDVWDDIFIEIFYRRNNAYAQKSNEHLLSEEKSPARKFDLSTLTTSELIKLSAEIRIAQSYIASGNNKIYHSKFLDIDLTDLTDSEFDLLNASIEISRNARAKIDKVDVGKKTIRSFFAACAEHGIYFDSTQPQITYPDTDGKYCEAIYDTKYKGKLYSLSFCVYTDGRILYLLSTMGTNTSADDMIYAMLASSVAGLDEDTALNTVKDYFLQSYLDGGLYTVDQERWNFTVSFSTQYQFLSIVSK